MMKRATKLFFCLFYSLSIFTTYNLEAKAQSGLQRLMVIIFGPRPKGVPRIKKPIGSVNVCFLSFHQYWHQDFQENSMPVLSQSPLLIWKGNAGKVVLQHKDLQFSKNPVWERELKANSGGAMRSGKILPRDRNYKVRLDPQRTRSQNEEGDTFYFYILDSEIANQHERKLKEISQKLKGENPETIALNRAEYLGREKLFLDAIQEITSIARPSAKFQESIAAQADIWIKDENYLQAMSAVFSVQNPTSNKLKQLRNQLERLPCFPPEAPKPQSDGAQSPID
jgi:hypothetical protein